MIQSLEFFNETIFVKLIFSQMVMKLVNDQIIIKRMYRLTL